MKVLDLFAGWEGWSAPFRKRGHDVISLDLDPRFGTDIVADVLTWHPKELNGWRPDIVLASPPCEMFSTGGWHQRAWEFRPEYTDGRRRYRAVSDRSRNAARVVRRTVWMIEQLEPRWWVVENPKALLRKLDLLPRAWDHGTVWYCHYGERRAKPTDLWGRFPPDLRLRPPCHYRGRGHVSEEGCCCLDHNAAPRGSITGTQGMPRDVAAVIPYKLALSVCKAAERSFG